MPAAEPEASVRGLRADRQRLPEVDGAQVAAGLRSALAWLQANQEAVNDLNVFPVPDGDTGSNMYLTLRSAVEEVARLGEARSASAVMKAAAHGSLMGARGNSGVILSQILRGFAQGLADRPRIDARGLAAAFEQSQAVAYKAVMKPTEGTVLTVVRESAAAATRAAEQSDDVGDVLDAAVREAHASVERTPDQLAVLREAGVVDAGGFGYAVILEGFARAVEDAGAEPRPEILDAGRRAAEPPVRPPADIIEGRRGASAVAAREQGWGYCTEFLINGPGLDVDGLREELGALGESSLVVGDEDLVRVHIHTQDPTSLIGTASQRGRLSKLKVEDMSAQHHDILERADAAEAADGRSDGAEAAATEAPAKPLGVVTVARGDGFRAILQGLGADAVVEGGQTMNPSTQDLLEGVRAAGAESVIILPNNRNVILTAEQVDSLAGDVAVRVVPTRSLPQGVSALIALDSDASVDVNVGRMKEAIDAVTTVEVTRAVRDSIASGKEIKAGDVLAVVDDEIAEVGSDPLQVVEAVLAERGSPCELITVYRGADVDEAQAGEFVESLRNHHPDVEFEVHEGGQEHYPYILSLE